MDSKLTHGKVNVPADLADKYRDLPLEERTKMLAKTMSVICAGLPFLTLVAGGPGEEAVVVSNVPPEIAADMLEDALTAAREQAKVRGH